jgi:hypothetical protein
MQLTAKTAMNVLAAKARTRLFIRSCRLPRQDRSGHLGAERNGLLRPLEFVKLESFARKRWTWEINALPFAKLTCEMGAREWLSLDMRG